MVKDQKFILNDETGETIDITNQDFQFVQNDKKIYDQEFSTKPVTFFKDSLKRFGKSKSSVVGAIIVGILAVLAIIVPSVTPKTGAYLVGVNDVGGNVQERFMQPKLLPSGVGFWDGTIKKNHILYDKNDNTPVGFREGTFSKLKTYDEVLDAPNEHGTGGAVNVFCNDFNSNGNFYSKVLNFDLNNDYIVEFGLHDATIDGFSRSEYRLILTGEDHDYILTSKTNDGYINDNNVKLSINEMLDGYSFENNKLSGKLFFEIKHQPKAYGNILLRNFKISSSSSEENETIFDKVSFKDGNTVLLRTSEDIGLWTSTSGKRGFGIQYTFCDFIYDQYEDVFGIQKKAFMFNDVIKFKTQKLIDIKLSTSDYKETSDLEVLSKRFPILNENGLIYRVVEQVGDATFNSSTRKWENYELICEVHGYKLYGYDRMPYFIFGTNSVRKDYLTLIFTGLRFSFLLAIVVSSINIAFGLVWGSISGYFGGWTDIVMERFVEILSGLPGTVVITLCILYGHEWDWGTNADVIALMIALFMTGWMGVSGRTRTQFYRFKGREYVLASRTLGAKDSRLIFKHILPNSLGTIITGSILMIPGVIYTEASIAYLKLGLTNQIMFGVVLSQASQYYKGEQTYLLIIPTLIMALLLISFNLFGNGLRDAFNPTLKGSE